MQKSKQFLQFLKSLKFRLILLIVVIAVVPSLILSAAVLKYYEKRAVSIRESEILSQAKILAMVVSLLWMTIAKFIMTRIISMTIS